MPAAFFSSSTKGFDQFPLRNPNVGDLEARRARPGSARDGTRDNEPIGDELIKPDLSSVSLSNRVSRQESELTRYPKQFSRREEEVGERSVLPLRARASDLRGTLDTARRRCRLSFGHP